MHFLIGVFAVDNGLGRFDMHSLTDECRMELMLEGLTDKSKANFENADGSYQPVCSWSITKCDADKRVVQIYTYIPHMDLEGTISLDFVPPLVRQIKLASVLIFGNQLRGTINTADLPEVLEELDVQSHEFGGTVDMTTLPNCLKNLNASANLLSGTLCLSNLPPKIEEIDLERNTFCGEIRLVNIPETLKSVYLGENSFNGIAVVSVRSNLFVEIGGGSCNITSVTDENGEAHPEKGKVKGFEVITS